VTDGGCYRVPVTARPKYAPKLILLSLAGRCCSPGLSGCVATLRALLHGGSECKPSGAAVAADGHDTDPTSLDPPMAAAPGTWIAVPQVPFTSLSFARRRGPFFCGGSSARPECRWLPPPPSPLQHHAFRLGQPPQDKAIARSAACLSIPSSPISGRAGATAAFDHSSGTLPWPSFQVRASAARLKWARRVVQHKGAW